jgi:hypothetical protein
MEVKNYLIKAKLPAHIIKVHEAITTKQPIDENEFDQWYTNKPKFFLDLENIAKLLAKQIRRDFIKKYTKDLPEHISKLLTNIGTEPRNWEDSPDGTLTGLSILLAGWVASQLTAKAKNNPNQDEKYLLKYFQLLINGAIEIGIEIGKE